MKFYFILGLSFLFTTTLWAKETWTKTSVEYEGLGLRIEVVEQHNNKATETIATKVYDRQTNELKEGSVKLHGNLVKFGKEGNSQAEYYFTVVGAQPKVRPNSNFSDCNLSDDQRSISCPTGLYVKAAATVESYREDVPDKKGIDSSSIKPAVKSARSTDQ